MSHKTSLTVTFLALLTACGSSQNVPERTSELPYENNNVLPVSAAPIVVNQDANETVTPGPVQPNAPVSTVAPAVEPNSAPVIDSNPAPTPTPSPTASPNVCTQIRADGSYDYTCGTYVISPTQGLGCPTGHATLLELMQDANGQWMDGSYVVMLYQGGGISWDQGNVSISAQGNGVVYVTVKGSAGRGDTQIPCIFTVAPN